MEIFPFKLKAFEPEEILQPSQPIMVMLGQWNLTHINYTLNT